MNYVRSLAILMVLILPLGSGIAQQIPGTLGSGRMSLGSTWTRHDGLPHVSGGSHRSFQLPVRPQTQFFGGVTVGQGFQPFFFPGYIANGFYYYGVPPYALGSAFGTNGFHFPLGRGRSGRFYRGVGPLWPSYYYGGSTGYSAMPSTYSAASIGGTAYRSPVSRSQIIDAPRIEFGTSFERPTAEGLQSRIDFSSIKRQAEAAIDRSPIAGEFAAAASGHRHTTTIDKLESQRLQSQGDLALNDADPELARTFYQAAVRAAPNRQTPWLRMALVHVIQREYPKAAAEMNRALLIHDDPASQWMNAEQLLNISSGDRSWLSDVGLWKWLQDHPGSADRLLLTASYQYFLGDDRTAAEVLDLALAAGTSQSSFETLHRIVTGHPHASHQNPVETPSSRSVSSGDSQGNVSDSAMADPGALLSSRGTAEE